MTSERTKPATKLPRRVVLGVCGGIAAYKSPEIARRLVERGVEVQVVMTDSAAQFVTATSLQAVSGRPVRDSLWDSAAEAAMGHIELARWADKIVIAPATAHCMAQLAHGSCADLLTTLCLASHAGVVLAPAMNQAMWLHPATQRNRDLLVSAGVEFLGPADGAQACGDIGPGRMLEPIDIVAALAHDGHAGAAVSGPLNGLRVVLTAGPTREPIDPVRYITNRSSGKMGFALAAALRSVGADVLLVAGPVNLRTPAGIARIDVETAQEMHDAVHQHVAGCHIFIGCAAVADYRPAEASPHKIKRASAERALQLEPSPDVLASVAALPNSPFTVGFAAETDNVRAHAQQKLLAKQIDIIAANLVGDGRGFDNDTNELHVFWREGEKLLPEASKSALAEQLVAIISDRYAQSTRAASMTSRVG